MSEHSMMRVWDPFIRVFHWTVVATFFIAYLTEEELLSLHVWAGYLLGAAVLLRIVWGFVGPKHARFTDFIYPPATVITYLRELLGRGGKRYIGHSPAGGANIVLLLICLVATVWTGLVVHAVENKAGPLAGFVAENQCGDSGMGLLRNALANDQDEHENEASEGHGDEPHERWEELHEFLANLTLVLVLLHIGGVLLASYAHRENLIKAMFTGEKRSAP